MSTRKLRIELDAKAEELGISRAKLIEIALKSELGHFNVHKENKRLTEARAQAEQETEGARKHAIPSKRNLKKPNLTTAL